MDAILEAAEKAPRGRRKAREDEGVFLSEFVVGTPTTASRAAMDRFWDSFTRRVLTDRKTG